MNDLKMRRRKIGVATLLLACACMVAWARSMFTYDGIWLFSPKSRYGVVSNRGCLTLQYAHSHDARGTGWDFKWDSHQRRPKAEVEVTGHFLNLILSNFSFVSKTAYWGYYSDLVRSPGPTVSVDWVHVQLPYWFLVAPVTILSAYLLLCKPRRKPSEQLQDVQQ